MSELKEQIRFNFGNKHNSIAVGLERFSSFYPGIIKGRSTLITGSKSSAKTKLLMFFIMEILKEVEVVNDPIELDVKIFIYLLKQDKLAFRANILASFLFRDHGLDIPYLQLMSIPKVANRTLTQSTLDLIDTYDEWFKYFDSKVSVYDNKKKPSEIFENTKEWLDNEAGIVGVDGKLVYDNPNLFVISCCDVTNFLSPEFDKRNGASMDLKKAMDKHAVDNNVILKNNYKCAIIDVQDQAADKERMEYDFSGKSKEDKLEPSIDGLGDSKTTNRAYDFILGIHYPWKYEFTSHKNYNTALLQDNYRSLKLIASELGGEGARVGLWFDGGSSTFEELPKSANFQLQTVIEAYIKKRRK